MARSRPGIEYHGGDADYKPVYEALKDIMANHSVLKNLILAFDRTIKPKHLPVYTTWDRETDIVDIAIIVINTMRVRTITFLS